MRKFILLIVACVLVLPSWGKTKNKTVTPPLSVEREQQFTYYWYAARQAIEEERYPDALVLLEFCRAIKPNDGQTLSFLGVLYNGIGKKDRALEAYRLAFEADPGYQWYRYSYALLEQRTEPAQQEAKRVMEKAMKANPKSEELLEQLLRLYISRSEWKKAIAIQDKLDKLKGFDAYSALNRYRIYAMWGKPKKAIAAVDKYLEVDPVNLQFLVLRVEAMERIGVKKEELYSFYERILAMQPNHLGILNNYAYHLATHGGDLMKAERMSEITIREEPDSPIYLDTYGWILHLKGQNELASFYLKRALQKADKETSAVIEKHLNAIK